MFVHISPEADALGETISTLKFAERVSTVELGAARANKETGDVKDLKEQVSYIHSLLILILVPQLTVDMGLWFVLDCQSQGSFSQEGRRI